MTTGLVVLAVAVLLAAGFGLWRAASDGRFRGTHAVRGASAAPADPTPASVVIEPGSSVEFLPPFAGG